ncbi:VacJ family lipoprotein [Aquicoccus porphyridii]|uniref:VacJ family lipoprotein n=1 Tax=Aquicoccus porphyridii TaxID=1852029 RepID=A0A5A9Z7F1_9RHOB|nr:VacJ family lipoprotein [Aquicoccus porphyridii]RAI54365.1 VacJ family lipoprotein [Rhodobacteraceae bacterium AsT-22]
MRSPAFFPQADFSFHRARKTGTARFVLSVCLALGLSACSVPGPGGAPDGIHDPYEQTNRKNHELNRALDRGLVRPASKGYVTIVPDPVAESVSNFAANLSLPGTVVNNLLQGDLGGALQNTYRFAFNTVFGIGGLGDPASELGIAEVEADFGGTLHVWGVPEGAYVELPVLGPSTERDAAGRVVDLFTNPLTHALPKPEKYYGRAASVASKLRSRGRFSDTVDSVLYESADSYSQSRLIYLQNRRFELGGGDDDTYIDPYDDPYGELYDDPYSE